VQRAHDGEAGKGAAAVLDERRGDVHDREVGLSTLEKLEVLIGAVARPHLDVEPGGREVTLLDRHVHVCLAALHAGAGQVRDLLHRSPTGAGVVGVTVAAASGGQRQGRRDGGAGHAQSSHHTPPARNVGTIAVESP
jgi:hypothetical protein